MVFSLARAYQTARLSELAYNEDHDHVRNQLVEPEHPEHLEFLDVQGCQAMCIVSNGVTKIVFRGTEFDETSDVMADIDIARQPDPRLDNVHVHTGFREELDKVWSQILEFVRRVALPDYHDIVVTGHSLGGGIAFLCAARLAHMYDLINVECYSYGAPVLGGYTFGVMYQTLDNLVHYRIRHNNDKVPEIQLLEIIGYKHQGELVHLTVNGQLVHGGLTWKQRFWDWVYGHLEALRNFEFGDSFRDHRITHYVEILQTNLDQSLQNTTLPNTPA